LYIQGKAKVLSFGMVYPEQQASKSVKGGMMFVFQNCEHCEKLIKSA